MSENNRSVFGIFATQAGVEALLDTLVVAYVNRANISILFPYNASSANNADGSESAAAPGFAGDTLGSRLSIIMLGIPGVGPFLASGPLAMAFENAGASKSFQGIANSLCRMGIPQNFATLYETRIRRTGFLIGIHNLSTTASLATREILALTGAEDIFLSAEAFRPRTTTGKAQVSASSTKADAEISTPLSGTSSSQSVRMHMASESRKTAEYVSPAHPLDDAATRTQKFVMLL